MRVNFHDLREAGWYFVAILAIFYAGVSLLEPQRVLWRKPGRKLLITCVIVWAMVLVLIASSFLWSHYSK
jgi:hypothetical protein